MNPFLLMFKVEVGALVFGPDPSPAATFKILAPALTLTNSGSGSEKKALISENFLNLQIGQYFPNTL